MEKQPFERYQCWNDDRISEVINKEAVSIEKSDFLATHAPLNSIMYEHTPQQMTDRSEQGLLHELRRCAAEHRHTFAVVQGIPGIGKSHLIRWLKESYDAADKESQGNDVILLIERAQCNLRGTLQQIIQSGVFQDEALHRQLEKLKGATTELSKNALADTILDQLRIATSEVQLPDEQLPQKRIRKRIEKFLLDFYVRQELKKLGGPIDRITRFLSVGNTHSLGENELPGFVAADFVFDINTRRAIRDEGYREAKELADQLQGDDEIDLRHELAQYLNRLLNYAVGRTTALSANDLNEMFNELRRHLRKQNRQLSLFIEDITAFTGIDVGLIDVLATQHTGESNREFCRLLSVIGITDHYFNDRFPDNMRERVTHRLTLNTAQQGIFESDLLKTSHATADLSARYLNAMRLDQKVLERWVAQGAHPERLPNACDTCQFKTACHRAFGFVELGAGSSIPQQVGLYPFNERAIWTMYKNITRGSQTPRSLLNSILEYVLESHGKKVSLGAFPPPPKELGSDFKPPSLAKLAQLNIINMHGGNNARRIETLVLFWGTRTVDVTNDGQNRFVGGLSEGVYKAFNIPFIEGEVSSLTSTVGMPSSVPAVSAQQVSYTISPPSIPFNTLPTLSPFDQTLVTTPHLKEAQLGEPSQNKYTEDINNWLRGEKLHNYEKLRDLLITLIASFVDWEAHGISSIQVDDRLTRRRIAIEDQVGKILVSDSLIFKRSDNLAAVLQAVAALNEDHKMIEPAFLAGYLTVLGSWLSEEEPRIVDFVRRPTSQSTETMSLTNLLLLNCVLLACLQEELEYKAYSTQDLLLLIIQGCTQAESINWQTYIDKAQKTHGSIWIDLMRNKKINAQLCRSNLLQMLNRAQGDSQSVRFIDAATALDILKAFEKSDWTLSPVEDVGTSASQAWITAIETYNTLQKHFVKALAGDRERVDEYIHRLKTIMDTSEPNDVFRAITDWIRYMRLSQRNYKLEAKSAANASRLSKVKTTFEAVLKDHGIKQCALRLSGIAPIMKDALENLQYLEDFCREVSDHVKQFERILPQLRTDAGDVAQLPPLAEQTYSEIESILSHAIETGKEVLQ